MLAPLLCRRRTVVERVEIIVPIAGAASGEWLREYRGKTRVEITHSLSGRDDDDLLEILTCFLQTRGDRPWDH